MGVQGVPTPMLPLTIQFVIVMVAHAFNERMARRLDYLQEEVRVLKEALAAATGKTRIDLSAAQRHRLAVKGKALTPAERRACCLVGEDVDRLHLRRSEDAHALRHEHRGHAHHPRGGASGALGRAAPRGSRHIRFASRPRRFPLWRPLRAPGNRLNPRRFNGRRLSAKRTRPRNSAR
jgi:hypothetical protein